MWKVSFHVLYNHYWNITMGLYITINKIRNAHIKLVGKEQNQLNANYMLCWSQWKFQFKMQQIHFAILIFVFFSSLNKFFLKDRNFCQKEKQKSKTPGYLHNCSTHIPRKQINRIVRNAIKSYLAIYRQRTRDKQEAYCCLLDNVSYTPPGRASLFQGLFCPTPFQLSPLHATKHALVLDIL